MRYVVLAAAVLAMACNRPSPGPVVQKLLDSYAPGLPLGQRVPDEAHQRYGLKVAPYEGYSANEFQGPDGLRVLTIRVDQAPGDGSNEKVSGRARIDAVMIQSPNAATTARIDQRFREVLGAPKVDCYTAARGFRVETRYWPAENNLGVRLDVFPDSLPPSNMSSYGLGWAIVIFGAEQMTSEHVKLEACS